MSKETLLKSVVIGGVILVSILYLYRGVEASPPPPPHPPPPNPPLPPWYEAPTYGNYPFPDTSYLQGITPPQIWYQVSDLTATNLRDSSQRYSLKSFLLPSEVSYLSYPSDPLVLAIIKMYQTTIAVPYVTESIDFWRYPTETLSQGGDCEDTSFLLASIVLNRMSDVWVVGGFFLGDQIYVHAWVVIKLPGKGQFIFETTLDSLPSNYWHEVHNDIIGQFYMPLVYWNNNRIYITDQGYLIFLQNPQISHQLSEKKEAIEEIWRKYG